MSAGSFNATANSGMPNGTSCTASLITLSGAYTIFDVDRQSTLSSNSTGLTIINGCSYKVSTSRSVVSTSDASGISIDNPFASAIFPLIFALAVSTTISYVLFLMTFMAKSRRPWLQRCGALGAMVVLTLAADLMFSALQRQEVSGSYRNADSIRDVRANTVFKALRVVAETTLWLAEVQVLIRLFPRHRDKVVIKWSGLCLIVLETVFAVLNDFFHPSPVNPNSTNSLIPAIPALNYLFEIAIGVLYAACVVFYSITNGRWRHAYSIPRLPLAVASIVSICSPTIFFCLDIWDGNVEGWGDYVRIASTVAASVIVWDWIDQVEACIDKVSNNGILGREVFEDEMTDGKAKKHKTEYNSKTSRVFSRTWRSNSSRHKTRESRQSDAIELPIIVHPLNKAQSYRVHARSVASGSTSQSGDSLYVPMTDGSSTINAPRSINSINPTSAQEQLTHQQQRQPSDRSATTQSSSGRPNGSDISPGIGRPDPRQDIVPHAGFSPGDYWPDEKDQHDAP